MNNIRGLKEYVNSNKFKNGMGINNSSDISLYPLARGEYNINYWFIHPENNKKYVFRINTESQMHLKNQIDYEYSALKLLEDTKRTPKVFYVDGSKSLLDFGVMVMEFLEGKPLDYTTDLAIAAECLADIHSKRIDANTSLIKSKNPLKEILEECENMFFFYKNSTLADNAIKYRIEKMLEKGNEIVSNQLKYNGYRCCINTELNSGNFLINGKGKDNYIIDWEKPLYGDYVQDLGHFLAPTTTFWKTDVILSRGEIKRFIRKYIDAVNNRFKVDDLEERLKAFIQVNCLRGITWCSMAYVNYQQDNKIISNIDTFNKIKEYLNDVFLNKIENLIEINE